MPYQAAWRQLFEEEQVRLQAVIGEYVLDIQHVGSTSIPGLPAKPIIDVAVAVRSFEEAVVCIQPVESLGYTYLGENGIPRRHYFRKGDLRTHHLHMNEVSSRDWENQVLFRDYLLRHPEAVQAYAALKIELAERFPSDREAYTLAKDPFIKHILYLARLEKPAQV